MITSTVFLELQKIAQKYSLKSLGVEFFVFGSHAQNTAKERSDFDLGIEFKNKVDRKLKHKIQEDLDAIRTLQEFDFVDFSFVSKEFYIVAKKQIISLIN